MIGLRTLIWKHGVELIGVGRDNGWRAQLGGYWRGGVKIHVNQSPEGRGGVEEKKAGLRGLTDIKSQDLVSQIYRRREI